MGYPPLLLLLRPASIIAKKEHQTSHRVPGFESQISHPLPRLVTVDKSLSPSAAKEHTSLPESDENTLSKCAWHMVCLFSGSEMVKRTELGSSCCLGQGFGQQRGWLHSTSHLLNNS